MEVRNMWLFVLVSALMYQLATVACNSDVDHLIAEASEPNVIQIDAYGKVSTNSDSDMDERRLMLEEMRLKKEMMMRKRKRNNGPTIIMVPNLGVPPPQQQTDYQPPQSESYPDSYASDSKPQSHSRACYVTTNICDGGHDRMLKNTVQRTVQKSIEASVKSSLKSALLPIVEELTRRMGEDLPIPVVKKYQEDMQMYASKYLDKM